MPPQARVMSTGTDHGARFGACDCVTEEPGLSSGYKGSMSRSRTLLSIESETVAGVAVTTSNTIGFAHRGDRLPGEAFSRTFGARSSSHVLKAANTGRLCRRRRRKV